MPTDYYRIIYYDDERKKFGVSDIVISDKDVTNKTIELKRKGKEVRVSVTAPVKDKFKVPSVDEVVKSFEGEYKYDPTLYW